MQIGTAISSFTQFASSPAFGTSLDRVIEQLDESGVHSLWVMDHFFQVATFGQPTDPMLESYATISYVAGRSRRLEVGVLVTGVSYRHPGVLVKAVTSLDVLSNGRVWLGIGAAWNADEAAALGIPFPALRDRFDQLEQTLAIAKQMWAGDRSAIVGTQYSLADPLNVPAPVRRPHPPILIGGSGERRTLRLVAEHGDACNLFEFNGVEHLSNKLDVLRRHCDEVKRDYDSIVKTTYGQLGEESDDELLERFATLAELGVDLAIIELPAPADGAAERLARLVEAVSPLGRPPIGALARTLR